MKKWIKKLSPKQLSVIAALLAVVAFIAIKRYLKPAVHPDQKAVYEYNAENGMKINDKAAKTIGLATSAISGSEIFTVPTASLVYFEGSKGVYRLRDGWFKLVEIEIAKKQGTSTVISSKELTSNDQIAVQGVALLRVAELDAKGGEE